LKPLAIALAAALAVISSQAAFADPASAGSGTPINVSAEGLKKTVQFKNWKVLLDTPTKIGTVSRGLFCTNAADFAYNQNFNTLLTARVNKVFNEKSHALGYPKYTASDSAFGDTSTPSSADYKLGFTLLDLNQNVCINESDMSGTARIRLKAELYSNKLQKVVYSRTIDGTFTTDSKIKADAFLDKLLANAMDGMFADAKYVNSFRDIPLVVADNPAELIQVKNGAKPVDKVAKDAKGVLSAVVTIESGPVSGSGFYIGRDGYVITNQHVVGDAKYVKVKLSNGFSVPGEVVRKNTARDVALVKTDLEPPTALFVRTTAARAGEEVFAVGSPFGAQLSNTITRGILSGERTLNEQRFIQSDVAINPGNSGGPLIDADGGLIAIADMKRDNASGIGLFIPIAEVLEKLGLSVQ
jgi:hypothetical protein